MEKKKPLFSVIIPTYNRATSIIVAIESVLNQVFLNWELIIVDDGSTDRTNEVVTKYKDQRIKYFYKENEERGRARNFGIEKAMGLFIAFLDSDDYYYPNYLDEVSKRIQNNQHSELFFNSYFIGQREHKVRREIPTSCTLKKMCNDNFMAPIGVVVKKSLAQVYPFNEDRKFVFGEDLYVFILWYLNAKQVYVSNKPQSLLLQHHERSVQSTPYQSVLYSYTLMFNLLRAEQKFMKAGYLPLLKSNGFSLVALYASINGDKTVAINYLIKSLVQAPTSIFRIRNLATIKRIVLG